MAPRLTARLIALSRSSFYLLDRSPIELFYNDKQSSEANF
jgi:hypothetical protein